MLAALSSPGKPQQPAVQYETPPDTRQHRLSSLIPHGANQHANAVALPASTFQGGGKSNQSQPLPLNGIHAATASEQPIAVNGLNSARADDNAVGQLQAALGQLATNAFPGMALPEVCSEVQYLRQSYVLLLQRMTTLEASLHGMERQQQLLPDSTALNQLESQHAQHDRAATPVDAHDIVACENQGELKAAVEHLPAHTPNASQQQHSMHSVHSMRPPAKKARAKGQASRMPEQQTGACLDFHTSRLEAVRARQKCSKLPEAEQSVEDRQMHRSQVRSERIPSTRSALINELFVCSLSHI